MCMIPNIMGQFIVHNLHQSQISIMLSSVGNQCKKKDEKTSLKLNKNNCLFLSGALAQKDVCQHIVWENQETFSCKTFMEKEHIN